MKQQPWKTPKYDLPTDENIVNSAVMYATVVVTNFPSAGNVDVDSVSAKNVWRKIFGACPAMALPGNVRIVAGKMASVTSEDSMSGGVQN